MPQAARVTDLTVTGDPITGPGVATVLIGGLPASVLGDLVSGTVCVGAVTKGSATVSIMGRPAVRVGDTADGVHAVTGVKVNTAVAPPGAPTVIIGG